MVLLAMKTNIDIIDEIALFIALQQFEIFKSYNKPLWFFAKDIDFTINKIPIDKILL